MKCRSAGWIRCHSSQGVGLSRSNSSSSSLRARVEAPCGGCDLDHRVQIARRACPRTQGRRGPAAAASVRCACPRGKVMVAGPSSVGDLDTGPPSAARARPTETYRRSGRALAAEERMVRSTRTVSIGIARRRAGAGRDSPLPASRSVSEPSSIRTGCAPSCAPGRPVRGTRESRRSPPRTAVRTNGTCAAQAAGRRRARSTPARPAGARPPIPPTPNISKMLEISPKPKSTWPGSNPAKGRSRDRTPRDHHGRNLARFSWSDSTANASATSLNRSSACLSPLLTSGWYLRARRR